MTSKLDELDRLASLRERGVLSEPEFAQAKAEVLAGTRTADADTSAADPDSNDPTIRPEDEADISIWEIFRPIETTHQANSLLGAGYYAATAISVQGAIFLSRYPVVSDEDNVVVIVALLIITTVAFLAARSVSKRASAVGAWVLLIIAGCQAFGTATEGRWDGLMIALAMAGVATSIQSIRATSAVRRLTSPAGTSGTRPANSQEA